MVKIIAQGINNKEIANFSPITSPPNTLVNLFSRINLAKAVYPSFYSYYTKAYIAQDLFITHYKNIKKRYPDLLFPSIKNIFHSKENKRLATLKELISFSKQNPLLDQSIFALFTTLQDAQMAFEYKDLYCIEYTSVFLNTIREYQKKLFKNIDHNDIDTFKHDSFIDYAKKEQTIYNQGLHSTQLLNYNLGISNYQKQNLFHFSGSIVKQTMGSLSNLSMQRGSAVDMAYVNLNIDHNNKLKIWELSLLKLQKFKERLHFVPSYFSQNKDIGLGLSVLNYEGNEDKKILTGTLVGGEILFNIVSSRNYNQYSFASIGVDYKQQKNDKNNRFGFMSPISLQNMFSFYKKSKIQWENKISYYHPLDANLKKQTFLSTNIRYTLGKFQKILYLLHLKVEHKKQLNISNTQYTISLSFNHY